MSTIILSPIEARVVGCLVEKALTTPQYYPMSVNALTAACNQKNSRNPVMALPEGEVGAALNRLEEMRMVKREDQGSRVPKWKHRFNHEMLLKDAAQAVLVTLMLRGPQTLSEIRANAAGLNGPADQDGVQAALADLSDRAQPLVTEIGRGPGQSAVRFRTTIVDYPEWKAGAGSPVEFPVGGSSVERSAPPNTIAGALEARIAALEARVAELEKLMS